MRNKTLGKKDRDLLLVFARQNISCATEQTETERAYEAAVPLVMAMAHTRFPPADMTVLRKYDAARQDHCIHRNAYLPDDMKFDFNAQDARAPWVPIGRGCSSIRYEMDDTVRAAIAAYNVANQKLEKARKAKMEDYRGLILGCKTFNEVTSVWPAAEAMRVQIVPVTIEQRALTILSADLISRIRSDNAGQSAAGNT